MALEDRGNAFENKYKHDEEVKFKVEARLAKLFGLWVAGHLGLESEQAKEYAKAMVNTQLEEAGNDDIIRKADSDLKAAGKSISLTALQAEVDQLEAKAREQIMNEVKKD